MKNRYVKLNNKNISSILEEQYEESINNLIKDFIQIGASECILMNSIRVNIANGKIDSVIKDLQKYIKKIDENLTNAERLKNTLVNNREYLSLELDTEDIPGQMKMFM